jgi:hypothetical protein
MIGRREFIALLGGAAAAWPFAARAQQASMPVVSYFGAVSTDTAGMIRPRFERNRLCGRA